MEQVYEQSLDILPGICDDTGKLSYHDAFRVCMDIAAAHAQALGCGPDAMSGKGLFWLTVKTQLQFHARPRMMEQVRMRTWPEQPGKLRCNRSYQMLHGDSILLSGKTEWAVIDLGSKLPVPVSGVYPSELQFDAGTAAPEPFARIQDDFQNSESIAEYRVRSTDIDLGGHMNNAAYLRAMFGCFPCAALHDMKIGTIDVAFRRPCFEGEVLMLQLKSDVSFSDLRFAKKDGSTALLVRFS